MRRQSPSVQGRCRKKGDTDHERISQKAIHENSQKFRQSIDDLLGCSHSTKTGSCQLQNEDNFLKSVIKKCNYFKNCYEPFEVIGEAYKRGQKKISRGGEIPNPEAWMRKTIWNILLAESRRIKLVREKHVFSTGDDEEQSLIERIPSPIDYDCDDEERICTEHERVKSALRQLKPNERKLLKLREVEEKSWDEIAKKIKFKGKNDALRKQGSRALKKLKAIYIST